MAHLIFLSHIHEEKELAALVQSAIEDEFGGFVKVFVSSDGQTIPAGTNLLKIIEDGLIKCIGAIYLISPYSVKRNWINFELGAVWIRNIINQSNNGQAIPTIPICHSGMTLSSLPMPLSNLNAIQGNIASQLEFAFRSIQTAVGGSGRLNTDFILLESQIRNFEKNYTTGENLMQFFSKYKDLQLPHHTPKVFLSELIESATRQTNTEAILSYYPTMEENTYDDLNNIYYEHLNNVFDFQFNSSNISVIHEDGDFNSPGRTIIAVKTTFQIKASIVLEYAEILKKI